MLLKNLGIYRRYFAAVLLIIIATPFVGIGAIRSINSLRVAPEKWAPASYESRQTYEWFADRFETGDVVLVSWDGCTVDDPRLAKLETILGDKQGPYAEIIDRIATGAGAVRSLEGEPLELSRGDAVHRLRGSLVGEDGRTSCAAITLTKAGNDHRDTSIQTIRRVVEKDCEVPSSSMHVVGPPVNGDAIDVASVHGINVFSNLSILLCLILCWICVRSWLYTLTIIGTGVLGQAITLSLVYYSGHDLDAILIVIPSLVLVLTVSAGVHLVNYYRDEVRFRGVPGAAERALAKGVRPCILAAVTTATGFGSLAVSEIAPVMLFGIVASIGVLAAITILLMLLPGTMELWPISSPASPSEVVPSSSTEGLLNRLANSVLGSPNLYATVCMLIMVACGTGLARLSASVDAVSLFADGSRLVNDYRWFESHIGPSVPVEVVVRFDKDSAPVTLQQLRIVKRIQDRIEGSKDFGGTLTAATFAPSLNRSADAGERLLFTAILNRRLHAQQQEFIDAHFLADSETETAWRISTRMTALGNPDYTKALGQLEDDVADIIAKEYPEYEINLLYTGMMPLASTVQQQILADLYASFLTAVALVAVIMIASLRSLTAGLLSMLPNVFPVILVFGAIGTWDIPIDIGMIMTASVALGIAIDDTLHFVTWYRQELKQGTHPNVAIRSSFQHCGRAMIQTSIICGLGLQVFALSDFVPTQRFAWMMGILLGTALLADLIFLPALMSGFLRGCFKNGQSQTKNAAMPTAEGTVPREPVSHRENA